jgi:hypothetical protein
MEINSNESKNKEESEDEDKPKCFNCSSTDRLHKLNKEKKKKIFFIKAKIEKTIDNLDELKEDILICHLCHSRKKNF